MDTSETERITPVFQGQVLVCEHDPNSRKIIQQLLSKAGIYAVIAPDGEKGVMLAGKRVAAGNPFDLILAETNMPDTDGTEIAGRLEAIGSKAPVVGLDSGGGLNHPDAGFAGFLTKPFTEEAVLDCLTKHLSSAGCPELPALDRSLGLELSAGDKKLYKRLLIDFNVNGGTTLQNVRKAAASGDLKLAHRLMHTFKGFAALIGATRLQESAAKAEYSLRSVITGGLTQTHEDLLKDVEAELDAVLDSLSEDERQSGIRMTDGEQPAFFLNGEQAYEPDGMHELSILIADDEETGIETLSRILSPNYTVYTARSGQAALSVAREVKPDLIILDVVMSGMDGFETLAELQKSEATRHIPVVFVTGLDGVENEEKGLLLGAVDYIAKPFHPSIVNARVVAQLRVVKQMRVLERNGLIDALTGLPNRRSFDAQIELEWGRAIREKNTLCMLIIDVDHFKNYNDIYGHQQGDAVLRSLAKVFAGTVKRTTDLVFRWGGEEFVVILPDTAVYGGVKVAESIRRNVENAVIKNQGTILPAVTVSIGVADASPAVNSRFSELIDRADKALYNSKMGGRNKVCIS